ncbi:SEL1-like repeat protein [Thiothrix winogradskyi]|uniref:SEL1-like repeat protein n=1 Tax=Thiothrix winogradskyi TaxID=96472 RepID=A0ABY3T1G5_9GAMM|nr:SEL1-like repeat protein [Thiothrix winogradskyi]UJS25248.1 SEL1-like repeat protein [Thiothrix winogradskyi]
MKIDRFWMIQIIIIISLFALLIGSYLFSFGWFANKSTSLATTVAPAPVEAVEIAPPTPAPAPMALAVVPSEPPKPPATCTPAGETLSSDSIRDSLSSSDGLRQTSCLEFLQAESLAGDKGAELWIGQAHHHGWGVVKNLEEAASHYQQAALSDDLAVRDSAQQWLKQLEQEQALPN